MNFLHQCIVLFIIRVVCIFNLFARSALTGLIYIFLTIRCINLLSIVLFIYFFFQLFFILYLAVQILKCSFIDSIHSYVIILLYLFAMSFVYLFNFIVILGRLIRIGICFLIFLILYLVIFELFCQFEILFLTVIFGVVLLNIFFALLSIQ